MLCQQKYQAMVIIRRQYLSSYFSVIVEYRLFLVIATGYGALVTKEGLAEVKVECLVTVISRTNSEI